jgi:hypothetical protein
MTNTDIRIMDMIAATSDAEDTKKWEMRSRHIFEMAWLTDKQKDRRAKYFDLRSPLESIEVPPDLFVKVEIKRVDSHRIEIYFDGKKQDCIADVKIELLPARPAKVTCIQHKVVRIHDNGLVEFEVEMINDKKMIATREIELLASSLTINI